MASTSIYHVWSAIFWVLTEHSDSGKFSSLFNVSLTVFIREREYLILIFFF